MPDRNDWVNVDDDAPTRPISGRFVKWVTPPMELGGEWVGVQVGKFGEIGALETDDGRVLFSTPTDLARQLRRVPEGAELSIRFLAIEETKSGGSFKKFAVAVRPGTPLLAATPEPPVDKTASPASDAVSPAAPVSPRWPPSRDRVPF